MSTSNKNGYYINGKEKAIELLQHLNNDERKKLLQNIGKRNAVAAKELSERSYSFKDLLNANDETIENVFKVTKPAIVGLALYLTPKAFQRKVLSLIPRAQAERAYEILSSDLSAKKQECLKAQNSVLLNSIELSKRNIISLSL